MKAILNHDGTRLQLTFIVGLHKCAQYSPQQFSTKILKNYELLSSPFVTLTLYFMSVLYKANHCYGLHSFSVPCTKEKAGKSDFPMTRQLN